MKETNKKSGTDVIPNERLNTFLLRSGIREQYSLSVHVFNIKLEVLAKEIKQENELKGIHIDRKK